MRIFDTFIRWLASEQIESSNVAGYFCGYRDATLREQERQAAARIANAA